MSVLSQSLYQLVGYVLGVIDLIVGLFGVALSCFNAQGFSVKMGSKGYGDLNIPLNSQDEMLNNMDNKAYVQKKLRLDPTKISWNKWFARFGIRVFDATFESPAADILPHESKEGHFWYVQPMYRSSTVTVIVLASTGEEHILPRILLSWYWAVFYGYASILLTSPLYGCRKPAQQNLFFIDTMADMIAQLLALCQETVALSAHIMDQDPNSQVIITGFSIAGGMSVFAAALAAASGCDSNRIGVVPYVGATDPSCVVEGMFSSLCDWAALVKDSPPGTTMAQVQKRSVAILKDCIANFDQLVHTRPGQKFAKAATLVDMSHDRFFPVHAKAQLREQVYAIARGVKETELPGGHITAAILRPYYHSRAVVETVQAMA